MAQTFPGSPASFGVPYVPNVTVKPADEHTPARYASMSPEELRPEAAKGQLEWYRFHRYRGPVNCSRTARPAVRRRGSGRPRARRTSGSSSRGSPPGDPDPEPPPPALAGRSQGRSPSPGEDDLSKYQPQRPVISHGIGSRIHGHP